MFLTMETDSEIVIAEASVPDLPCAMLSADESVMEMVAASAADFRMAP